MDHLPPLEAVTVSVTPPQVTDTVLPASARPLRMTPAAFSAAVILSLLATRFSSTVGAVMS